MVSSNKMDINSAIGVLLEYGMLDPMQVNDRNYLIWMIQFFFMARQTAKEAFGF